MNMRKLALVVMSSIVGLVLQACTATPADDPSEQGFLRGTDGQAVPAELSTMDDLTPQHSFDQALSGENDAVAGGPEGEVCSGWCNANVCVCSGSFECCSLGCDFCWQVIDSL